MGNRGSHDIVPVFMMMDCGILTGRNVTALTQASLIFAVANVSSARVTC
jgi:hypothetical protein